MSLKHNYTEVNLTTNEGVLIYIFFAFSTILATYALWVTNIMLLILFWGGLFIPFYLYRFKVCINCQNKCPFNPTKRFWTSELPEGG